MVFRLAGAGVAVCLLQVGTASAQRAAPPKSSPPKTPPGTAPATKAAAKPVPKVWPAESDSVQVLLFDQALKLLLDSAAGPVAVAPMFVDGSPRVPPGTPVLGSTLVTPFRSMVFADVVDAVALANHLTVALQMPHDGCTLMSDERRRLGAAVANPCRLLSNGTLIGLAKSVAYGDSSVALVSLWVQRPGDVVVAYNYHVLFVRRAGRWVLTRISRFLQS
jgi:hypothetical protein